MYRHWLLPKSQEVKLFLLKGNRLKMSVLEVGQEFQPSFDEFLTLLNNNVNDQRFSDKTFWTMLTGLMEKGNGTKSESVQYISKFLFESKFLDNEIHKNRFLHTLTSPHRKDFAA